MFLADAQALAGGKAIDGALDVEQRVDAFYRLTRERGDGRRLFAAPGVSGDIGQFEELAPGVRPTQRRNDGAFLEPRIVKPVIAAIGVGLQDAGKVFQMALGMLLPPVPRGVIKGGRRRGPAKGAIVSDVDPDAAGDRLGLRQDRYRRVVAEESFGRQNMGLDQRMQRLQRRGTGADLVGQRRDGKIDAFAGIALALPLEGLVLAELLEQDHGQKVGPGKAARRRMKRHRRLRDGFAAPAGEFLADRLDDFPTAWNNLQRLGDVFA